MKNHATKLNTKKKQKTKTIRVNKTFWEITEHILKSGLKITRWKQCIWEELFYGEDTTKVKIKLDNLRNWDIWNSRAKTKNEILV